jgi:hypothetical protein
MNMSRAHDQLRADLKYARDLLEKARAVKVCHSHNCLIENGPVEDAFRYLDRIVRDTPRGTFSAEWYQGIVFKISNLYEQAGPFCPCCPNIGIEMPDDS